MPLASAFAEAAGVALDEQVIFAAVGGTAQVPALQAQAGQFTWSVSTVGVAAASQRLTIAFTQLDPRARVVGITRIEAQGQVWEGTWTVTSRAGILGSPQGSVALPDAVGAQVTEGVRHLLLAAAALPAGTYTGGSIVTVASAPWRVARAGADGVRVVALAGLNQERAEAPSYPLDHGLRDEITLRLGQVGGAPAIIGLERLATAPADPGQSASYTIHRLAVTFAP
jgi:hypothetical protein